MSASPSKVGKSSESPRASSPAPANDRATRSKSAAPADRPVVSIRETSLRSSFLRTFGSFVCSSVVHMLILIALGLWIIPVVQLESVDLLSLIQEARQDELTEYLDESMLAGINVVSGTSATSNGGGGGGAGGGGSGGSGHGAPLGAGIGGGAIKFDEGVAESSSPTGPGVGPALQVGQIPGKSLSLKLPEGMPGDPQAPVSNLGEAMDRLTQEIVLMMETHKVLVIWLFDESESMKEEQKELRDKIERVYTELGLLKKTNNDALTSAVASYGDVPNIHTKTPTHEVEKIKADMNKVPIEDSGKENMCHAIIQTLGYYRNYALKTQRKVAVVILTDETGEKDDSLKLLENAVAAAQETHSRIYVLGREAVFGYPYAYMAWREPKTQIGYWLQIDRGPETPFVEQLQTEGFWRRWDAHGSGFGPYEQSRLARETGGIMFLLPSKETNLVRTDNFKYELERLRPYLPNLEARAEYAAEREKHPLQALLWKVINDLNPWDPELGKTINLRQAYSIEPAEFAKQSVAEMAKAERYVRYLHKAEEALEAALPLRQREIYPRWQANFDLIYAQVIAYKVRVYEYGAYLHWFNTNAEFRPKPALRPPQNNPNLTTHWDITTRAAILPTDKYPRDKMEADIKKATELFNQIIKDYEGTPWANRAKWELARGFGVHVVQDWDDIRRGQGGVKIPKL